MSMGGVINARAGLFTKVSAHVATMFDGPELSLVGSAIGERGIVQVTMSPTEACELAWALLMAAEQHGNQSVHRVAVVMRQLEKRQKNAARTRRAKA